MLNIPAYAGFMKEGKCEMYSTGVDIIEVDRIKKSIERFGKVFLERIFTKQEVDYCEGKNVQKFQSYAGRFAAKEAVFKAVSGMIPNKFDIEWTDIEVLNLDSGRPYIQFHGSLAKCLDNKCKVDVSISHISEIAMASAIVEDLQY